MQACEKLQVPKSTILTLIRSEALKLVDHRLLNSLISCSSIETFYENYAKTTTIALWLKIPAPCIQRILSKLAITPIASEPGEAFQKNIYAVEDIAKYFHIPDNQKAPDLSLELEPALVNVSTLWKKHDIRGTPFGRVFLNSGYTDPIKIGAATYLLQADALKIDKILERHYTFSQANRYLGITNHSESLIRRKKLNAIYPLNGDPNYPMIDKIQLHDYAIKNGFI